MKPYLGLSDFSLQTICYGVFRSNNTESFRVGIAIGQEILDLAKCFQAKLLNLADCKQNVFASESLNAFMSLGYDVWKSVRQQIQTLLSEDSVILKKTNLRQELFYSMKDCQLKLPVEVGNYTDFYAGEFHAKNVGAMFRPNMEPLLPNWRHMPVAYHGRSSSIVVSGTPIKRPKGQILLEENHCEFLPTRKLDYEVELGFVIGTGNQLGEPIAIEKAKQHVFGVVLVNDWSARDIQSWEYVPLGPFLSKSFSTSISPWVVSLESLESCMIEVAQQQPQVLPYLQQEQRFIYDIEFDVQIQSKHMSNYQTLAKTNSRYLYWTLEQMVAHHTVNGCNLQTGDLLASGTISGPELSQAGCLLEQTWNGTQPIRLQDNSQQYFLSDGDSIRIEANCKNQFGKAIGLGSVEGTVLSAE